MNTTNDNDYDALFAYRIYLQDDYENESDIIKELEYQLIQKGMSPENIPKYLKSFYEKFGINISLDTINDTLSNNNLNQENNHNDEDEEDEYDDEDDTDDNDIDNELPPLISTENLLSSFVFNITDTSNSVNFIPNLTNFLNHSLMNPSIFTNISTIPTVNIYQDVITTLDEEDMKQIKKYKTDKTLEEKCSICMSNMEKEEEICELHCGHNYHSDCIEPWLKEYNYKCPICRKEVGKPKFNV